MPYLVEVGDLNALWAALGGGYALIVAVRWAWAVFLND